MMCPTARRLNTWRPQFSWWWWASYLATIKSSWLQSVTTCHNYLLLWPLCDHGHSMVIPLSLVCVLASWCSFGTKIDWWNPHFRGLNHISIYFPSPSPRRMTFSTDLAPGSFMPLWKSNQLSLATISILNVNSFKNLSISIGSILFGAHDFWWFMDAFNMGEGIWSKYEAWRVSIAKFGYRRVLGCGTAPYVTPESPKKIGSTFWWRERLESISTMQKQQRSTPKMANCNRKTTFHTIILVHLTFLWANVISRAITSLRPGRPCQVYGLEWSYGKSKGMPFIAVFSSSWGQRDMAEQDQLMKIDGS